MATALSAFDYGIAKTPRADQASRMQRHEEVIHARGLAPNRYRILAPALLEAATMPVRALFPPDVAFRRTFTLFTFAEFILLLVTHYLYLRIWFTEEQALVGMLAIGCILRITLEDFAIPYQPWSYLEPSLLALGLLAIVRGRTGLVLLLTAIGSLNRETGVLVPFALLIDAIARRSRKNLVMGLAGIVLSVVVFFTLRVTIGYAPQVFTLGEIWHWNRHPEAFRGAIQNVVLFLGGTGWILAACGFRRAPEFVRQTFWLLLFYVPMYLVWGLWLEVRLLMPLYPVLIPSLLSCLYRQTRGESQKTAAIIVPTITGGANS
jgi:hypothetical protein